MGSLRSAFVAFLGVFAVSAAAHAALELTVTANPDPAAPGETVNVQIHVSNSGASPIAAVSLELILPAEIDGFDEAYVSGGGSCDAGSFGNFCESGEAVVWSLGDLAAGSGLRVSLPPILASDVPDGTLVAFAASATGSGDAEASDSASVVVQSVSFLRLSLETDRDPAEAGSELTYRLRFGHVGTTRLAEGTLLELPLPAGASFVSATGGGTLAAGVVSWSLGTLFPSEGGVRELVVALDAGLDAGELLDAQATIADTDTPPQQARARSVTRVGSSPLAIAIAARPDPVASGETLHTEVTVANTSLFPLVGVVLEMRLPDFVDTFDEDYASGPASCDSVGFGNFCDRRERIVWTLGELGAGQVATLSIPPLVNTSGLVPPDAQPIRFDAHVRDGSGRSAAASDSAEVQGESFLRLALEADRDPAAAGETLTYTVTYGHTGTARLAENAVLELPLPAGASFVSATVGGALDGDVVRWALGTLGLGEFCSREVTVALDAGLDAGALIEAHASIADTDSPPQRARAQLVTPVGASALSVAVEARPDPGRRGEVLEARVILTNTRLFPLAGVALELRLPDYLDAFNENLATGDASCDLTGFGNFCERRERILWSFDTLAAGESVTVSIPPQVNATGLVPPDGQLIPFVAVATAGTSQAIGRDVAHVGNPAKACDGDMDGITDTHDNCLNAPNADQTDTDLDGYGNRCDPDFNDDGRVGIPDFNLFRSQFGNDDTSEEFDPEVDLTSDGAIGIPDFNILRALFGLPPGPSGLSCAGTVPCD